MNIQGVQMGILKCENFHEQSNSEQKGTHLIVFEAFGAAGSIVAVAFNRLTHLMG